MGVWIDPWEEAILREEGATYCKVYGHSVMSCAKTAETIKMPFEIWTRVGQRNHRNSERPMRRRNFYGKEHTRVCLTTLSDVSCAKMTEPIEMVFALCGLQAQLLHGVHIGATWRILLKTPCAAAMRPFCQISLTTCLTNICSSLTASSIVPISITCTKIEIVGGAFHKVTTPSWI